MNNMNLPHFIKRGGYVSIANIDMNSSPFGDVEAAFHWQKKEYPFPHTHTHWELFVVIQGEIAHTINNKKFLLKKGDACLIRPADNHRLDHVKRKDIECQFLNFMMNNDFAEKLINLHNSCENLLNSPEPFHFTLDDLELASIYDKCLYIQNLPKDLYVADTKLVIAKILLNFFEQQMLFNPNYPVWFNNFLTYISNPSNFTKSTKELSEATPYSYPRLAVLFKNYTSMTMIDYITEKKMTYAKRLLRTTSLTTLQIADAIGYTSLSAFNHLFSKSFGTPPSEYRKNHRK